ncbi:hypothetical protein BKA66DRAFT_573130 [Pyrenochaeta sp. MPI-SDFR-AT-0127]|nr:hypothetical protein BKA66DRAFT_573130 [Pyrenochaeta sp. MPI-SDFR-AT-0127]
MNNATRLLSFILVLGVTHAISMVDYAPDCDVDPDFGFWYSELLRNNENATSTSEYTNFFAPNGSLIVLGDVATGPEAILRSRAAMLPLDGSIQWNHFPNTTSVSAESSTEKSFQVSGVLQTVTTADGNCSTIYFQTLFTVAKTKNTANLIPQSGSLLVYDGYSINASDAPCTK